MTFELRELPGISDAPLVIIDGRAYSGKTTLATNLAYQLDADLVRLDDCYPGALGMYPVRHMISYDVLLHNRVPMWDSRLHRVTRTKKLNPNRKLVVEGTGSLTALTIDAARKRLGNNGKLPYTIWIDCDERLREERAASRKSDNFAKERKLWARQEAEHLTDDTPIDFACYLVRSDTGEVTDQSEAAKQAMANVEESRY